MMTALTGLLGLAAPVAAGVSFNAEAVCIDNGEVVDGIAGGIAAPSASCNYTVNRTFPLRHNGSATASAQGIVGARTVGAEVSVDATLSTQIGGVFGGRAEVLVNLTDTFVVTGTLPLGTPLSNGLMDISALATGQIQLDAEGAATVNTMAVLNYAIVVGSASETATEIVFLGELNPGEIRVINVPFLIPAVPFLGSANIPIEMNVNAKLVGELVDDGSIDARIQFDNSLDWLGITKVTDTAGTPVVSFTAISADTGTDWGAVTPIPEPAHWLLFVSGLAVLAIAARRRCGT
jgi:hypothetical protein